MSRAETDRGVGGADPGYPGPAAVPSLAPAAVLALALAAGPALALLAGSAPAAAQDSTGGFELGAGIYLFHHQPLALEGADGKTEVYAFFLDLERSDGPWTVFAQARWRDTKLRPFFPSTTWLQEAWGSYRAPLGERTSVTLKAGKIYQRVGRFWDGSFFGNLQYFDGLKLDPEFGLEASLHAPLDGPLEAELYAQGLVDSDRVNGALAGRDLEGEPDLREQGLAAGIRLRAPVARPAGRELRLAAGLSGLAERVRSGSSAGEATLEHVAVDLEARWEPAVAYVEWTRRASGGPGALAGMAGNAGELERSAAGSRASWWLFGVRAGLGTLALRYNVSTARYQDAGFREWIHQPGLTLRTSDVAELLVEYDGWRREPTGPSGPGASEEQLDRSLNVVLLLHF